MMNKNILIAMARSPDVKKGLWKEFLRIISTIFFVYIGIVAVRIITRSGSPFGLGLEHIAGMIAISLVWALSVIKTIRDELNSAEQIDDGNSVKPPGDERTP